MVAIQKPVPIKTVATKTSTEKEIRSKKVSQSSRSCLAPVSNQNIDKQVQNISKIQMFTNGNLSTTTYKIGKENVSVRNTCAFDAISQVSNH